jgi:hypothetical protein
MIWFWLLGFGLTWLWWHSYTRSLHPTVFERIFDGCMCLIVWPLILAALCLYYITEVLR